MLKLLSICMACILCVLIFAGCNNSEETEVSSVLQYDGPPSTPPGLISSTPDPTPGTSSSVSSDTSSDNSGSESNTLQSLEGVIDSAAMGEFSVELSDGRFLVFSYEGVDTSGLEDTKPGSPILIHYYGTIDGTDTSTINIQSMETPQ